MTLGLGVNASPSTTTETSPLDKLYKQVCGSTYKVSNIIHNFVRSQTICSFFKTMPCVQLYSSFTKNYVCHRLLLFQTIVLWVTISDWPLLLVGIFSYYSKSSSPKEAQRNVLGFSFAEYHGMIHDTPWQKIHSFCQPSKTGLVKEEIASAIYVCT
jgi:hypothetical protein